MWTQIHTDLRMNSLPSSDVECGVSYQHAVRTSVDASARISVPHRCLLPRKVTENDMNEQSRVGIQTDEANLNESIDNRSALVGDTSALQFVDIVAR
jgi:hypothetical protein